MLLNILFFLLCFLHSQSQRVPDEDRWNIKYMSDTNGGEFDRVINGYDFDIESFEEEIPSNVCNTQNILNEVRSLLNYSGYVYCTNMHKGIKQMCPPGTEVSYKIGGCVNQTTNKTIFPIGSRCVSQPCQNDGVCFDFPSTDGYLCVCPYPYKGLHCHLHQKSCSDCGDNAAKVRPTCGPFTDDMALDYVCHCYDWDSHPFNWGFTMNNCFTEEVFFPKCNKSRVGALPFTNKGFYICSRSTNLVSIKSCPLHHVWNDTEKECVLENN